MECKLCGLPAPTVPLQKDGYSFCCFGCQEVYRSFGDSVLQHKAGQTPAEVSPEPQGSEAFLRVDGMHCASCEFLIEKIALQTDGILAAYSSYSTSTVKVIYDPDIIDESMLPEALGKAGYQARLSRDQAPEYDDRQPLLRLLVAATLAVTVMMLYVAFYYPSYLGLVELSDLEPVHWLAFKAVPNTLLVLTTVLILYPGAPIFRGAWIGLRTGILNMDNLLAIAILAAYVYSIGQLFMGTLDFYFDVVAAIIAVVTFGRYHERLAKARATRELSDMMESWSPLARVFKNGEQRMLTLEELGPGDHIIILEGEPIPVDGTIVKGQGAIDESLMTGEPFPVTRKAGEHVLGGTRLIEGRLEIQLGHVVESQMDNLARILWNAQSSTVGTQGLADRVARIFVPVVLSLAVLVVAWLHLSGASPGTALLAGMATLIVSCPCTFGLAIPLTTAVGLSTALRNGIIFTRADSFDKSPRVNTVAIDKTGILSTGDMLVTGVIGVPEAKEYAAAVERLSPHPIAEAIADLDSKYVASDVDIHPGKGAIATVNGHRVVVGSQSLFRTMDWDIPVDLSNSAKAVVQEGGVISYVGWNHNAYGAIVTEDQPRADWQHMVAKLRENSRVILLTGAENAGIYGTKMDQVFAGIPPEGKSAVIRQLKSEGSVVMIGDGSNDAPALAAADLGIAFGAPTALAADAADVVIPGNQLQQVFTVFELIHTVRLRIRQNLGWALLYNVIAIPLAITGLLNPLFAALAMSASSLLVIWNSTRSIDTRTD